MMKITTRALAASILAACALLLLGSELAFAQRLHFESTSRRHASSRDRASGRSGDESPPVLAQGTLRHTTRDGLTLDGTRILLSPRAGIYPSLGDDGTDLQDLDGVVATVFGRPTSLGLRATFVIWRPQRNLSWDVQATLRDESQLIPSAADPRVGEFVPDAPR